MAKGQFTGGRWFAKGHKLSVGHGRPKLPPEIRELSWIPKDELKRRVAVFFDMSKAEIEAALRKPDAKAFELAIGSILVEAIKRGDHTRLQWLTEFIYGKEKPIDEKEPIVIDADEDLEKIPLRVLIEAAK